MKAFVIDKDLSKSVREIAEPVMADFAAKVKVMGCGLCGSDIKILKGKLKNTPLSIYPMVMGHEAVGRVVEVGKECVSYKEGDIVLMPYNLTFSDGYGSAWGAMAEYATVFDPLAPTTRILGDDTLNLARCQNVLPDWVDPLEAIMIITLRETLGALAYFGVEANQSIAIYGCGPVGMSMIQFCKRKVWDPIIALDVVDEKLDQAREYGADYAFNSADPEHLDQIRKVCPQKLDLVLDAVGVTDVYNYAMTLLKDSGKICAYGVPTNQEMELIWRTNPEYNWKFDFYQCSIKKYEYWAHNQVMHLVEKGVIVLADYISDYLPFSDIISVTDRFLNREFEKKAIITFAE